MLKEGVLLHNQNCPSGLKGELNRGVGQEGFGDGGASCIRQPLLGASTAAAAAAAVGGALKIRCERCFASESELGPWWQELKGVHHILTWTSLVFNLMLMRVAGAAGKMEKGYSACHKSLLCNMNAKLQPTLLENPARIPKSGVHASLGLEELTLRSIVEFSLRGSPAFNG
mmetsp:Transcript_98623/g.205607  ORF Transcript_98623/g.205607 Transcript_98623/m.205607 type:complete len:171 (-) Transcript_98623:332-844(-)